MRAFVPRFMLIVMLAALAGCSLWPWQPNKEKRIECGSLTCDADGACITEGDQPRCVCTGGFTGNGDQCEPVPHTISVDSMLGCEIQTDGSLWCAGDVSSGALGPGGSTDPTATRQRVKHEGPWKSVAVNLGAVCAIQRDDSLSCWGNNDRHQLGVEGEGGPERVQPLPGRKWKDLVASNGISCAIRSDDTLWCWGKDPSEQGIGGTSSDDWHPARFGTMKVRSVSFRFSQRCAVALEGTLWCWGSQSSSPVQIGEDTHWQQVAFGMNALLTLRDDGSLWRWDPTSMVPSATANLYRTDRKWTAVSGGGYGATCGLQEDGSGWCWGWNSRGTVGDGSTVDTSDPTPVLPARSWKEIAAGPSSTCGRTSDDQLWCWGDNANGVLGAGTMADKVDPGRVGMDFDWASVSAGGSSETCAVKKDGSLWCWGASAAMPEPLTGVAVPKLIDRAHSWRDVSVGVFKTCALRSDGRLSCWASESSGALTGWPMKPWEEPPREVAGEHVWKSVSAGEARACAIDADLALWCWGWAIHGQLGDGSQYGADNPVLIAPGTSWSMVSVGDGHTCGIQTDGSLWCWGVNNAGQLGLGSGLYDVATPAHVGFATWSSVAVSRWESDRRTCGIHTDGSLWCWGQGDVPTRSWQKPVYLPGPMGATFQSVALAASQACVLATDGVLRCSTEGRLLAEDASNPFTPVWIGSIWASVSVGRSHICGVQTDGSLWCWGSNSRGQLGTGDAWFVSPVNTGR